ncbi:tyrosine-type recombinase/integrase [Cohnella candidum]|uniref:Tyrosine recombinase XerS n=1 Tax=Cohnella candidum TaxID=2674991 RepID=A0A3G3JW87_9BACL|nr:tyrosine-type recombinase/integrase [Cohnella candidum]AYQ72454.1 tyrosine recombinase XerS [Cohnella candidum]
MRIQEKNDLSVVLTLMEGYPEFVRKFINYKRDDLSPSSLLEYLRDYKFFFEWMLSNCVDEKDDYLYITLVDLEALTVDDVHRFMNYILEDLGKSVQTMQRKVSSVRSLFNYLNDVEEDRSGNPLLKRNVFRKVSIKRSADPQSIARKIKDKVLDRNSIFDFIHFIEFRYRQDQRRNKQSIFCFDRDCERDLCIISLQLHLGLRVSDLVNLNIDDFLMNEQSIVLRMNDSTVVKQLSSIAAEKIEKYIKVREEKYSPETNENGLFLAIQNGFEQGKRMTKRAIQEMVKKYGRAYGKSELTNRQLRHSFGLNLVQTTDLITTKNQFGQGIETIQKYGFLADLFDD